LHRSQHISRPGATDGGQHAEVAQQGIEQTATVV
jgi:hypothetical protein